MWFSTKEGLSRFDGYRFKLFHLDPQYEQTLNRDYVNCLFKDVKGTLWIGSQRGLYQYQPEEEKMIPFLPSLNNIGAINMDKAGQLWFLSNRTVCRYNFQSKKLTVFPAESYFYASIICVTPNNSVWIGTQDGFLKKFNPATQSFTSVDVFAHSPSIVSRYITKVVPQGDSCLLIGTTGQGIKQFDLRSFAYKDLLSHNQDKTTIYVRDAVQTSATEYWFATESGIFVYHATDGSFTNLKKKFLDPYSLSDNAVYTLCKDAEGGIWAGTYFGGVNFYPKQYSAFQKFFPDNSKSSISGNAVREICEDGYGNLWIGTEDAGLNKLVRATGAIQHFEPTGDASSIAHSNIHGLMIDGNDLWIGTFEHGLDIMDVRTGKVRKHYSISSPRSFKNNFIVTFLKTRNGDIWVGSGGGGVYKYDRATDSFEQYGDDMFVSSLFEAKDKTIWIGTHNGVYYYNPETKEKGHFHKDPDNANSLGENMLNAICEDYRGNIWISTEGGGLCKLSPDKKTFTRYTTKNGLPSNFVFKVIEDNSKILWVSTSKGLVRFSPNDESMIVYTKENGILNDQFNYNSGYKDNTGKLYFGSVKGMIIFDPTQFYKRHITSPIYITGFQVHNKEVDVSKTNSLLKKSIVFTDRITLPYDQSSFSIDFSALSFSAPEMTEYSYIMDGVDKDWTHLKSNRKVYFTNLAPGNYAFNLRVGTNGQWSSQQKRLFITITPPFWATNWAYFVYVVVFISLAYYIIRSYHERIENKKEKEIYEAKIEFFTNVAHEIRTPLTLIKGPVDNLLEKMEEAPEIKEDLLYMERNTNRLMALVTQILDFRKTETKGFSLEFSKVNVSELVNDEYLNFAAAAKKKNLVYTIDLPVNPVFLQADEEALTKVFSNLFSNAVKYASGQVHLKLLSPTRESSSVIIELTNDGHLIPTEMKDRIFEPFYRMKESTRHKGTGIGLTLARSLVELHNGSLYLKDNQNGMNCFVVSLPLAKNDLHKKNSSLLKTH